MKALEHEVGEGLGSAARRFGVGVGVFIGCFAFALVMLRDLTNAILAILNAAK